MEKSENGNKNCRGCIRELKENNPEEFRKLQNRLSRVSGQVKGIQRMMENDASCPDVMLQVSAVNAALHAFNRELIAIHLKNCVVADINEGKDEEFAEFIATMNRLLK